MELKKIADEMQPRTMAARDWVFQVIRTALVRGGLPGGMPLRQGLVRIYPNRGAVVTKLSKEEIANIMDTRIMLELGAIRAALPHITPETLNEAQSIIDKSVVESDQHKLEDLNLQFHMTLYAPSNNAVLLQLIDQLHANVDRYIRQFYTITDRQEKSVTDHRKIIEACRKKDIVLVDAVLRTHLETARSLLMDLPNL